VPLRARGEDGFHLPARPAWEQALTPRTRAVLLCNPNNPTGTIYTRDELEMVAAFCRDHALFLISDEVYTDLAYDGPVQPIGALDPAAPVISFSSASKAYMAPGWRTGWMAVGASDRLDGVLAAIKELADGRLCTNGPMQYAVAAALDGERGHQGEFRTQLRERAALTSARLNAIEGVSCVPPRAAFYALPKVDLPPGKTDQDFVLGLLRATGRLCVFGSGVGTHPAAGYFRLVFLPSLAELEEHFAAIAAFTAEFRRG